jgi:predicted RNA-binding protein with PUA-like domain
MAGTRRSTRQAPAAAPKYIEDSSSSEGKTGTKRKRAQTSRPKRLKAKDEEPTDDEESVPPARCSVCLTCHLRSPPPPPPKKTAKPKRQSSTPTTKPSKTAPPIPSSETNRDPHGAQEVFWLLKAEPLPRIENGVNVAFSIDDLAACTVPEPWSGVRNPQARNNMQAMRKGDLGFFYHSNAKPSGVVGILRVVEEAKVDESAFDSKDAYYDAKSDREMPKWYCVGVEFVSKFEEIIDLAKIKSLAGSGGPLEGMQLVTNSRLSVSRVSRGEWEHIMDLTGEREEKTEKT